MKNTKLFKHLISDENIYMALYSIESYVFNPELLEKSDKKLFDMLNDKFNEKLINETIRKVRERITKLVLDDKEFVIAKVYFKPKKYDNIENLKFRPLHIACIIDQIAIVSMLNLLIYEIPDDENNKIVLSNISRLIPSNFYGNRVSLKAEELFKPWKEQYKEYTRLANESFKNYHNSLEYKYEVTLDLENFFPSVSPIYLYNYILAKIPVTLNCKERKLYKKVLIKLLYCKIGNLVTDQDIIFYYGKSIDESEERFCRGIPQGLPQSYFFGNICMIDIADIFNKEFNGKGFFYVDDSVIFTNDVEENGFRKQLNDINSNIKTSMEKYGKGDELLKKYFLPKNDEFYDIKVHVESGKSSYIKISEASEGEIYLKYLSREASQIGGDMFALYSEEEEEILRERTSVLVRVIKKEIDNVLRKKSKLKKSETETYLKKLNRYYKYFKYRQIKLNLQDKYDISEIKTLVFQKKKETIDLKGFFECYNNDIWAVAVSILIKDLKSNCEIKELKEYIINLNRSLFKSDNKRTSYIYKSYDGFLNKKYEYHNVYNKYDSLKKLSEQSLKRYSQMHSEATNNYIKENIERQTIDDILQTNKFFSDKFINSMKFVNSNSEEIDRMILNSIYSYLFNVEISDRAVMVQNTKKNLNYGILRVLTFLRNSNFTTELFKKINIQLNSENNSLKIDYSIIEVLDVFKQFIHNPIFTDNLIMIHQYTCDVWRNGSKYLYFYTLHNQEHAVELIKNIIKIVKAIDFIKITEQDYYILFISCYLHDISMVKIPVMDSFLIDTDESDKITNDIINNLGKLKDTQQLSDTTVIKKLLKEIYIKLDEYYEDIIRIKHASDSANEIRTRSDLTFLDKCLREIVAEVAIAHCYRVEDIYSIKSNAANKLISLKFDKILLRIADLLDMNNYRISRPILNHNLEQMSSKSAFHWISHLLTNGYKLETKYLINYKSSLKPKTIIEQLILNVYVNMSQLSEIENNNKCLFVQLMNKTLDNNGFELSCGQKCENSRCNFLCKWFSKKNAYLLEEFSALTHYLKRIPDNYYDSEIKIKLIISDKTKLDANQFEIIKKNIES